MSTIALDPHSLSAIVDKENVPPSVISFEELDDAKRAEQAALVAQDAVNSFSQMVQNIIMDDGIDREAALNRLVGEFLQRIEGVSRVQYNMGKDNETHEKAAIKRENGLDFPARDYAYAPDPSKPSTWKLRLTEAPGKVTAAQLGRAAAALSPGGFRGSRVQIPATAVSAVKRRIRAEYRKLGIPSQKIPNSVKGAESDFMVWKSDDGTYRWMAIYSNNFRDQDRVPEIISEKSHKTFEYMVDNGIVDYPEVWLWHTPGTAWGKADMITYADGFSLATGHVYEGKENVAEALSKAVADGEDIAVSHGMPAQWIIRNEEDPTVIDFHITSEISPLPRYAAANKMTGFVVFSEKQEKSEMSIPANKKEWLIDTAGLDPEWVERLESGLAKQRDAATDAGVESKEQKSADIEAEVEMVAEAEVEDAAVAPEEETHVELQEESPELIEAKAEAKAQAEPLQEESPELSKEETEVEEVTEVKSDEPAVTREELADVFAALIKSNQEAVSSLESRIAELEVEIKQLKKTDVEKIAEIKEQTPTDSLSSLIRSRIVGDEDARVDGRTSLAKEGPEETQRKSNAFTGSPFLNSLMAGATQTAVD